MTINEKFGREPARQGLPIHETPMLSAGTVVRETQIDTFSDVLDRACEGLMNKQIKHSIRQIEKMDERLCGLEQELDAFLSQKDTGQA